MNRLLFGDNLSWLRNREIFPDASVDLVYLDPPFNSNADYNVLFKEASGEASQAQFHAFTDTWNWADAAEMYHQFVDTCPNVAVVEMVEALHGFLKNSPMMAYLAMMAPRLVELQRTLKPTGSLYLHCDPTASHYLKIILDSVFGAVNFQNEIIWKRTSSHSDAKRKFGDESDSLLFYSKEPTIIPLIRNTNRIPKVTLNRTTAAKTGREGNIRHAISEVHILGRILHTIIKATSRIRYGWSIFARCDGKNSTRRVSLYFLNQRMEESESRITWMKCREL